MEKKNIYENGLLSETTGDTLRPGGFYLTDKAVELCAFLPGASILDVGCGQGATVNRLVSIYQLQAFGVDPSEILLEAGRQKYPLLSLIKGRGEDLPFLANSMDGIFCECSLSLMTNMNEALEEMRRVLKTGGRLIIHDVYARNPEGLPDIQALNLNSCLRNAISEDEIRQALISSGFQIIHWQDHSQLLIQLTVDLIMTHGSISEFWLKSGSSCGCSEIQSALKKAKMGYFQLIAQKV